MSRRLRCQLSIQTKLDIEFANFVSVNSAEREVNSRLAYMGFALVLHALALGSQGSARNSRLDR